MYSTFSFLINDNLINGIKEKISTTVENGIESQGEELILEIIHNESSELLQLTLNELYNDYKDKIPLLEEKILSIYHSFIENSLSKVLKAVNLSQVVEDRINGFDTLELEKILLGIMKKELNAIVWLGGLLGLIMGLVMNFF